MTNYEELFVLSGMLEDKYELHIGEDSERLIAAARGETSALDPRPTCSWASKGEGPEPDLVRTDLIPVWALSETAVDALSNLTGWKPVVLAENPVGGTKSSKRYSVLSITGRAGPVDPTRSEIRNGDDQDSEMVGLYFRDDYWDGSDIFVLKESAFLIFVTDKARSAIGALTQGHITPTFTRLSEFRQHPLGMQSLIERQVADGLGTEEWKWGKY